MHETTKPVHVLGPKAGFSNFLGVSHQSLRADAVLVLSDRPR